MKIRTGFVSNSSSSSFLIVGFTIKYDELPTYQELIKKSSIPIPIKYFGDMYAVGYYIFNNNDYDISELCMSKALSKIDNFKTKINEVFPDKKVSLIHGAKDD